MEQKRPTRETPVISVSQTGGLTSAQQLVDTTSGDIFTFKDDTSATEKFSVVSPRDQH